MSIEDPDVHPEPRYNWGFAGATLAVAIGVLIANEYLTDGRNTSASYLLAGSLATLAVWNIRKP